MTVSTAPESIFTEILSQPRSTFDTALMFCVSFPSTEAIVWLTVELSFFLIHLDPNVMGVFAGVGHSWSSGMFDNAPYLLWVRTVFCGLMSSLLLAFLTTTVHGLTS